jgi:hypothetical protein
MFGSSADVVRSGLGAARLVRLRREADIWFALDRFFQ